MPLLAVEVGVVCGTNQGVKLKCAALNKHRLKGLNTEAVKCRCAVEQHGMFLDDRFESVPHLILGAVDHLSGLLDVGGGADLNKSLHNEGLEELESHFLRQTALIHSQFRSYDDNGTS